MPVDFEAAVRGIRAAKDPRYPGGAYRFVMEALELTVKKLGERRHVTGRELLEVIRDYAKEEFGVLAKTVFDVWGISKTNDFGNIVFNLVEAGVMGKTEKDSVADFNEVYSFDAAFPTEPDSRHLFRKKKPDLQP
ncbi:MAG: hypothetical protein RDV41_05220 [Planctomycetota bacterium]|nr:hypothetical protein [Planctomycetota bacterium]